MGNKIFKNLDEQVEILKQKIQTANASRNISIL